MTATTTRDLVLEVLDNDKHGYTVAQLLDWVDKSETAIRTALKDLVRSDEVVKDGKHYRRPFYATDEPVADEVETAQANDVTAEPNAEDTFDTEYAKRLASGELDGNPASEMPQEAETPVATEAGSTDQSAVEEAPEAPQPATDGKRKYRPRRENPDRPVRTNHKTGSKIQVVPASDSTDGGSPWFTVCLTHDVRVGSPKIMAAWSKSTNPEVFCPGCADALKAKNS